MSSCCKCQGQACRAFCVRRNRRTEEAEAEVSEPVVLEGEIEADLLENESDEATESEPEEAVSEEIGSEEESSVE